MHKPVLASLSTDGRSPGHLAKIGAALGAVDINIAAIGGAEWQGSGAVALLLDHPKGQDNSEAAASAIRGAGYEAEVISGVTVELENRAGELGRAAGKLGDINIASILVVGVRGPRALVSFGVAPADEQAARDALGVDYSILAD